MNIKIIIKCIFQTTCTRPHTHTHTCPRTFTRQLSMLTSCTVRYDKHLGGPALQHKQPSAEKSGIYKKRCSNFRRPAGAAVRCKPVSSQLEPPCAAGAVMMTQRERELMWTMRKLQLRGLDNQAADAHINIHTDTWFAEKWGERLNTKERNKEASKWWVLWNILSCSSYLKKKEVLWGFFSHSVLLMNPRARVV